MAQTETTETTKKKNGGATIETKTTGGIRGHIHLSDDVVRTVAGMAAREIPGIHSLGRGRWIDFGGDSPTRGIAAEVGSREAAIDLDVVIEYGCDLEKVANDLKTKMAEEIQKMTTRDLVEVNINVVDVQLPEPEAPAPTNEPRVR